MTTTTNPVLVLDALFARRWRDSLTTEARRLHAEADRLAEVADRIDHHIEGGTALVTDDEMTWWAESLLDVNATTVATEVIAERDRLTHAEEVGR